MDIITAECYRLAVERRIAELWQYREWYRTHRGWIIQQRVDDMTELRILVRLAREARRAARRAEEHRDNAAKAWADQVFVAVLS